MTAAPKTTRRTTGMLVVGLALGCILGALLLTTRGDPEALPTGHFSQRLNACLPSDRSEEAYRLAGVAPCLRETLLDADTIGNLQTARTDLGALVAEQPWLHNSCHLAEHQVGSLIMDDPADVPALLLAHPGNTCSWGIGHGLLETFGAARPDETQWRAVIDTCRSLRELPDPYPEIYALCADGIGHAAWDHHQDLRGAVRRCEALAEESAVSSCTTGIMMQKYRPAETGKQPDLDPRELLGYCREYWPSRMRTSIEGCATGLGYVVALSLVGDDISGALARDGTSAAAQTSAATRGAAGLSTAQRLCRSLGDLAATCTASLITNLPHHLLTDTDAWRRLCGGLDADSDTAAKDTCIGLQGG